MRHDCGLMNVLLQEFLVEQGTPVRLAPRCPDDGKASHFVRVCRQSKGVVS